MSELPNYIVIEGPIGVGKTTLATRIAEDFNAELLLELAEENPFLEKFYTNPRQAALPTQLHFLMQRVRQIQAIRQGELFNPVRVADYLLEKDYLFAENTLDPLELELYEQVFSQLVLNAPVPDLVVYLQAPTDVLVKRIRKRGRGFEKTISTTYLQQLSDAYTRFFHYYDKAPLLIVNATEIDIVNNAQDYQQLLEQVKTIKTGRHYFNPLPFAM
ncbi:MAG TPA: deoxynucleoside kinase [Chromatiales bacterium]|nr:deoxynucleoside kinase [Thiotrichales bacterium]HIP68691.1 deoxynucleoside kinase [Chromatiales bacterium]